MIHLSQARIRLAVVAARKKRADAEDCYDAARALLDQGRIPEWQEKLREWKFLDEQAKCLSSIVRDLEDRQRAAGLAKLLDAAAELDAS